MTSNKLNRTVTGWFGESTLNGKKAFTGNVFFDKEQKPVQVDLTDKSITISFEEYSISFPYPLTSEPFQRFIANGYELVVKRKTRKSRKYCAFIINPWNS